MYNVICLKHGTKFPPYYVNRLFNGIKQNTTLPFTFHCLTENENGLNPDIVTHPLPYDLPTWWNKVYMFSGDVQIDGRVLYLDLDTLIVGNIDDIMKECSSFFVLRDFFHPENDNIGSGIMSFDMHCHTQIWDEFIKDPIKVINRFHPHGDQRWIQEIGPRTRFWPDEYPDQIVSFKIDCREGIPTNTRIICYHGKPSIEESITTTTAAQGYIIPPTPWVSEYWKD